MLAGAALAPVVGGVVGKLMGQSDQDKANAAQQAALQQILAVKTPDIEQQRIALEKEQSAGQLTPGMEGTVTEGPSAMGGISTDPRLREAQMGALSKLQQLGSQGLSDTDRMALGQINRQSDQSAQAQREAILQNMSARGVGGSGAALAAQLQASQSGADTANQRGLSIASQAQQNALNAIAQGGALGGQIQGQEFNQKAQQATAADAIARFNAMNSQNVMGANVNRGNEAQRMNLQNAQNIMNTNTGLANQQNIHNAGLYQQQYQDQLERARAAAGQYGQNASYNQQQAQAARKTGADVGAGIGGAFSAFGAARKQTNPDEGSTATNPDSMQSPGYP